MNTLPAATFPPPDSKRVFYVEWKGILLYVLGLKNRILALNLSVQCFFTRVINTDSCLFIVISVSQILV